MNVSTHHRIKQGQHMDIGMCRIVCLFVGCLTSQQHASASQGQICSDNFMCCHTEIEAADKTCHLTQSQYSDTGPTSPSTDPITPGTCQGSHWSTNSQVTGMTRSGKFPAQAGFEPRIFRSWGGCLYHQANEAVPCVRANIWQYFTHYVTSCNHAMTIFSLCHVTPTDIIPPRWPSG